MLYTGLTSITFRKFTADKIIQLTKQSGLDAIEWGGDIHVPHGDVTTAIKVKEMTLAANLKIASYGSYYRVGEYDNPKLEFQKVLLSAKELGAPTIRVWAGKYPSMDADETYWDQVINESKMIADMAKELGIEIAYEYHGHTLTDTNESALKLLKKVNHPYIKTYWQPPNNIDFNVRKEGLKDILPWLSNIHIFHWINGTERRNLEEGFEDWKTYLSIAKQSGKDHYVLLEFVKDDCEEQFKKDAQILKTIIE